MKPNSRVSGRGAVCGIAAVFLWLLMPLPALPGAQDGDAEKLESVLRLMERSSGNFRSFSADIVKKTYTAVLEEFDPPESGKFFYKRAGNGSALIREEITDPAEKITIVREDQALVYQPKLKSASAYKLGKHKDKAEYLALGIGQSPADLEKTFQISYQGQGFVNGSACSVLELKPRDPQVASIFSSITVWIDEATGVSKQIRMVEPFEDYILVIFSDEKLNEKIDDSIFEQRLPRDTDILRIN
ncbi:MAG: outer membrane lipoprotein carrier protein LolA [Acidobacteria bacterium]|nr:outer membrane lipoprotein carrier protein LolA [Acidobacteriota bacterium]